MQRVLVILVVILLVTASLGVGALSAHWPFWRRAWAWHTAESGWPAIQSGPSIIVRGGGVVPARFDPADAELTRFAEHSAAQLLLRARAGRLEAWPADASAPDALVDGRGLTAILLAPLFDELERQQPGLLDRPLGALIQSWQQDQRGSLTPRALLAEVDEGIHAPPATRPLNPFRSTARLASGPDFQRAALAVFDPAATADVDGHRAAAAQLLAFVASAATGQPFTAVLEQHLWSGVAAQDAQLLLDRRRGVAAAHCCMRASGADWLRLGQFLARAGAPDAVRVFRTVGRALAIGTDGAVVLWVGEGDSPPGLEDLVRHAAAAGELRPAE